MAKALTFDSASGAYRWAVEAAERPGVMSSTEVVIRGLKEQQGDASNLSKDEIRETALSILARVRRVEPAHARLAFQVALGPPTGDRDEQFADLLARQAADMTGKEHTQLMRVAHVAILGARALEQHGQIIPQAWYAHALGVRRQSLDSWKPAISEIQDTLEAWISQGKRKAKQELDEAGLTRPSEG